MQIHYTEMYQYIQVAGGVGHLLQKAVEDISIQLLQDQIKSLKLASSGVLDGKKDHSMLFLHILKES